MLLEVEFFVKMISWSMCNKKKLKKKTFFLFFFVIKILADVIDDCIERN